LRSLDGWFGTATAVVAWFRKRREVRFERVDTPGGARTRLRYEGEEIQPPLRIRVYGLPHARGDAEAAGATTGEFIDIPWNGKSIDEVELQKASRLAATVSDLAACPLS
jgi:hypothetical protein